MYECPNCSGNLKFDIGRQQLFCGYCGTCVDPYCFHREKDAEETVLTIGETDTGRGKKTPEYEVTIFTCPQCGGQIVSEDTTAATFCSFCGSAVILDSRISRERRPGYIIPFRKTEEDCRVAYARMMRHALYAPKSLRDEGLIERFRGIYMPYWVYSFEKKGNIVFSGKRERRRGDYEITDHYRIDCDVEQAYRDLAYDASASFSDDLSGAIAPFDLTQKKPFAPSFLSGFYADTNDVTQYVYRGEAENAVVDDGYKKLVRSAVCRRYRAGKGRDRNVLRNALRPDNMQATLVMLPVWFLAYRNGDRVSYAVVNGQTGRAAADLPVDRKRYLLGSLLTALPLFLLLNLFFTITPAKMLLTAICMAILCILISNVQINCILARESGEYDKGLASVQPASAGAQQRRPGRVRRKMGVWGKAGLILLSFYGLLLIQVAALPVLMRLFYSGNSRKILSVFLFLAFGGVMLWLPGRIRQNSGVRKPYGGGHLKEKLPILAKPAAGILAAALIWIFNPVSDWFYYIGACLCMGTVLWAIMDIIKQHNLLTTRKPPRFVLATENHYQSEMYNE